MLIEILLAFNGTQLLNEVNEINTNKPQFKNNKGKLYQKNEQTVAEV